MIDNLKEWDDHGEEHPDVDHLEKGRRQKSLGESQVTARKEVQIFDNYIRHLHEGKDEKDGEIYFNDHIHVVLCESSCCETDDKEESGRDEDCQEVVHDRSAHGHLCDNCLFFKKS